MKTCAYCGEPLGTTNHKKTDEHIIPNSLLKLYSEQDISIHGAKHYVDNRGMTISDVCSTCNSGVLSTLDSFGKKLIENVFYTSYEFEDYYKAFDISLSPQLFTRWILKIAYNSMRCEKLDIQYISNCLPYILEKTTEYPSNISILLGLHINLNPVPEYYFAYTPLQINFNPDFYLNSYLRHQAGEPQKKLLMHDAAQIISLRLGNSVSLVILWNNIVDHKTKNHIHEVLQEDFRFRLLETNINRYSLRSVSSPTNVMAANYGHFFSENAVSEIIYVIKESLQGREIGKCNREFSNIWTPEMTREGRALVEAALFPNNKKKQNALNDIIISKKL